MAVKKAETIVQYKYLKWVNENFNPDSVSVTFFPSWAIVTDRLGNYLTLTISEKGDVEVNAESVITEESEETEVGDCVNDV